MMNIIKRVVRSLITGYIVKIIRDLISGKSNGKNKERFIKIIARQCIYYY